MKNQIESEAMKTLRFDPQWFVDKLLPLEFFAHQLELWNDSADSFWASAEHHRYVAFQTLLAAYENFTDAELERYVALCQLDEDETMARAALIDLLHWPRLSHEQTEKLIVHPAFANDVAQKIFWRKQKQLELSADKISDELFVEITQRHDAQIERELVNARGIARHQLEILAEKGCNRAIRNLAKSRLKSHL